ncbi:hypothetical protein MTR67_012465 [Solanum verrucosum]|uniref:Uncharacterized protein n=1 Tax=Solanum verrucosum TaxID=315347 RepID=A0AAF0QD28_SOLVR|nr:hypothetical protein MTR67_012465 [Solanum verrucosum]
MDQVGEKGEQWVHHREVLQSSTLSPKDPEHDDTEGWVHPLGHDNHPGKANIIADALRRLSMGSTAHVEEGKKELAKDVHKLARLGVKLMDSNEGGVVVMNGAESSLVSKVKEKQDQDPVLLE